MDTLKVITLAVLVMAVGWLAYLTFRVDSAPQAQPQKLGRAFAESDLSNGGVTRYYFTQQMTQGASTTCNWQTPGATSTVSIKARFSLASTSAALVEFGRSAGPNATTTLITRYTLGAGAQGTLYATTSATGGEDDALVAPPNTWLAVKLGGGGVGSVPSGTCNFSAETLP